MLWHVLVPALGLLYLPFGKAQDQSVEGYPDWVSNDYNCVINCLQGFNDQMQTRPNPDLEKEAYGCVMQNCDAASVALNIYQTQYIIQWFYAHGSIYEFIPGTTSTYPLLAAAATETSSDSASSSASSDTSTLSFAPGTFTGSATATSTSATSTGGTGTTHAASATGAVNATETGAGATGGGTIGAAVPGMVAVFVVGVSMAAAAVL